MFSVTRRQVGGAGLRTASNGGASMGRIRQATCDFPIPGTGSGGGSGYGMGGQQQYTQLAPVTERLEQGTVAHDWIPRDTRTLNRISRLIYLTDPVAGPAIDFYREVPFGPVNLGGIRDEKRLKFFDEALDTIKLERYLPYLAGDILVTGRLIVHLLLNESKGYWQEMIVHDSDYILVEPSPIIGEEPTIDLMVPPNYQKWATSPDPRVVRQRRRLDPRLVKMMAAGATIPLSSENTIFIPRRSSAHDDLGTSLLMRILPVIAVEWAYLQAEVTGLRRRAAPWTIIKAGIEDKWEPTPEEMLDLQDMFLAAEEDPVGAKLVVRNGVEVDQIGGHTELAKWLEQWPTLKEAKLQGLGMNEAFATGEASWSYLESMLSLGMERIRNFRQFVATEIVKEGVLAPLARLHEMYKRTSAELSHPIRTTDKSDDNLDLPTVEWSRSLQPTADRDYLDILETIEGKGIPIPLRKWAQAAGYDIDEAMHGTKADVELRKRVADYKKQVKALGGGGEEDEEGGGYSFGSAHFPPAAVAEVLAEMPLWERTNGEFLTLSRGELPKMAEYLRKVRINGKKPGMQEWKRVEAQMKSDGIRMSKIRSFRYLMTRAGMLNVPLPPKTVVRVRDHLLRQANGTPDRHMMQEIYWLNHELEKQGTTEPTEVYERALPNSFTAPWVRPASPYLLTGDGYAGMDEE